MGKHIEQRHDSLPDKQEEIQILQTNEDTQSCRSRKSSSKSNCFVRQQLKIDAEIKKRKLAQEIVDLELAMQVSKLEQEEVDGNSESIIPITINTNGNYVHTHALLDDASTVTLIDQDLADELHMDGPQRTLTIQWTNNQVRQQDDSRIFRNDGKISYLGNGVLSMTNAKPKVLIGQDNWPLLVNKRIISGPWNGPALSKTLLGWVLHGNVSQTANTFSNKHTTSHVCHMSSEDKDDLDVLHDLVKQQWQIDSSGVYKLEKAMSKEDMVAQSIMDRTMTRSGGRIETGLLWKDENVVLPESKKNAMRRLICTERKMDKNEEYGRRYCQKFDELVKKKYIRKLNNSEICGDQFKVWYLPHFGIINPNKPDKLRIVFDASAKSNVYAFTADIKEMFLQVRVKKDDCSAQRVLFREMDRTREPDVYEIEVVFFGSTCGPCLAQEAKNKNAQEFKLTHPDAVHDIIEKHYMDDYLGGADTIEAAHKLIADVIYIHTQPWTVTTDNRDLNLMNSWRSAQRLADFFWKRWLDDYLPTIIKRSKWYQEQKNIKVDDIVIIVDPNGTRNDWRKARVVKTYPAKDGRIRIVDVKDGNGKVYRRALSKLIVLDLQ
ncbi:uncharacterized protein LOC116174482 [Photinus pyralis]|uniref:uncharacterized protein LOC116174482 n=1 Tax=Photinus pyralis TaxID=7054 RepID=UPI0012674403|nr:uncharacterized protein LOC116174482 [Photinus pyralis]